MFLIKTEKKLVVKVNSADKGLTIIHNLVKKIKKFLT